MTTATANAAEKPDATELQRVIESIGDTLELPVGVASENDLNPTPARLAFDLQLLTMRVEFLERKIKELCAPK
jgi:hypothetical protein